jgi:hypothetical protein
MDGANYEELRRENIRRNNDFLKELGLLEISSSILQSFENNSADVIHNQLRNINRKRKKQKIDLPMRKSSRKKNSHLGDAVINPTADENDIVDFQRSKKPVREYPKVVVDEQVLRNPINFDVLTQKIAEENDDHRKFISDQAIRHCIHRVNTMSNNALATRLKRISRYSELYSTFITNNGTLNSSGRGKSSYEKMLVLYYALKIVGLIELSKCAFDALSLFEYHDKTVNDGAEVKVKS